MNAGILTYYGVHNHGALLQANALQSVLKSLGYSVHFLSFNRSYEYISQNKVNKYKISLKSIPYYIRFLQAKGIGNVFYNLQKSKTLKYFRTEQFQMIPYSQFNGDVTIVGSDEVFSLEIGYNPFMYGYGIQSKHIISYAGSFGPSTIMEIKKKGKDKLIKEGFDTFDNISVRDINSKNIIQEICGKDVPITCDPVLLYGYSNEQKQYLPKESNYIVIYAYDHRLNDTSEIKPIIEYAKKNHLKIYSIAYYHDWCDKNINVDPIELLGWIRCASLVITDTFHGSVLSIICNTPMVVRTRQSNEKKLNSLLNEYGLLDRKITDFNNLDMVAKEPIDFEKVNLKVNEIRQESLSFLIKSLENCKNEDRK